jgi:phosphate-selective porin OprO/OprP
LLSLFCIFAAQLLIIRMKFKFIPLFFCLFLTSFCFAQETDSKKEIDDKIAYLPYIRFGTGIGITSPDSLNKLNIRFRMQNRVSFNTNEAGERVVDGQIRRLRLRFDGYVGNPKLMYALQLSFAPGDVGAVNESENLNIIRDAVVFYSPNKYWLLGFGQTKLPGNRQRINSSGGVQLTDRSINNARFNIDRDFGLLVYYSRPNYDRFTYNIKTAISGGEGRNFTSNDDMGLAYTGKIELFPGGNFTNGGDFFEGDLEREKKLKTMFSVAYQFNDNAKKTQGQLGEEMSQKADLQNLLADFMLKKSGFAFMATYMQRNTKNPLLNYDQDKLFIFTGHGFDLQSSYITKKNIEFIGRYSNQKVDKAIANITPDTQQFTGGITKYIREHAFKIQAEFTYQLTDNYLIGQSSSHYTRFQIEMGI